MRRGVLLGTGLLFVLLLTLRAQPKPAEANWIWFDEGDPISSAPAETRYFRRVFTLDQVPAKADLEITADNGFSVWVNGTAVGEGNSWEQMYRFDVRKHLKQGKNVLAVEGRNEGGPAGLIVKLAGIVVSDRDWKAAKSEGTGWRSLDFDEKGWKPVKVIGPYGKVGPWARTASGPAKPRTFNVPEGFKVELAVKRPDDRGPFSIVNMCFDAKGRLLLSQEGGPTLLCVNPDKDGVYQGVVDYCTQVKGNHGMCWVGDALLLVGDGPKGTGLYRCRDTKGVDKVDEVTLLHKFQGGMGEHGPHAVIHGPDGWLYVVIGNHSWAQPEKLADNSPLVRWPKGAQGPDQGQLNTTEDVLLPRLNDANGHAANIRAPGGTIWRMDLEGKNVSLFSAGYRNHFDAAFSPSGELFTFDSDMEWDEGLPWYRAVRVNHATPGSDFVWRTGAANTPNYYLDSLPPLYETGRGSPVGVEYYDHFAFPPKYRTLFVADWSLGIIYSMHLERFGASYKAKAEKFCTGSPLNVTDLAVGPDGALYFSLGGRGTQGSVQRIVATKRTPQKDEEDPQPLSAWGRASTQKWIEKAIKENGRERLLEQFANQLLPKEPVAQRDPVKMLALMQNHVRNASRELLEKLLGHKTPELRAEAARLIGVNSYQQSKNPLVKALSDEDALVRRRACEALVRARIEPPVEALGPVLADDDPFVRTAARLVLQRMEPKTWAERLFRTDNKRVVREGIVALCKIHKAGEHTDAIFDRLHEGSPGNAVKDVLDYLRTIQLALIHTQKRPGSARGIALDCLEMFPHKDAAVNRELAILLTQFRREKILDEPVHTKLLKAVLETKDDRPQQIHYFYCLRLLHDGWTAPQKQQIIDWFEATKGWSGGASFQGFLHNILADFGPVFTKNDRAALVLQLSKYPHTALALLRLESRDRVLDLKALETAYLKTPGAPRSTELKRAIIDALGRLASPESRDALIALVQQEPAQRDVAIQALARSLDTTSWPVVLQGLESSSKQILFEVIQALKRSPIKPKNDDPKPVRALLLASSKLDAGNRGHAVDLLRHWAGSKRFSPDDRDWKGELNGWVKWFAQTFPKEQALPDLVNEKPTESKWKFDELLAYLEGDGKKGDATKGRIVFEKGQCFKCHKYGKEGEGLGPDLTTVSKRFKRTDTLESLFYPSKVISDQYRSTMIVTKKGQQISGLMAVQGDVITVLQTDGMKVTLKKSEIEQQLTSLVSVMAERLLDSLTKEEIRDLFAFLESEAVK